MKSSLFILPDLHLAKIWCYDLTVAELRTLIYLTVEELLLEFFGDPDQGLSLNPKILKQLLAQQQQHQQ